MRCGNCLADNPETSKYCKSCGTNLSKRNETAAVPTERGMKRGLNAFIGQDIVKERIKFQIELAKRHGAALGNMIICGREGEGKAFLAKCIAEEMGVPINCAEAGKTTPRELSVVLASLRSGDILLLNHIEHLNELSSLVLVPAVKDVTLGKVIGEGLTARSTSLKMRRFTLIGSAPDLWVVPESLRNIFDAVYEFTPYDSRSLAALILWVTRNDKPVLDPTAATEIAKRANGSLAMARRLARRAMDYAILFDHCPITEKVVKNAFLGPSVGDNHEEDSSVLALGLRCIELLKRSNLELISNVTAFDGGVDILTRSNDPFTGGKYIVRCSASSRPVDMKLVQELYGLVQSEDANKGIMISASSFSQDALDFASGKRLELIDVRKMNSLLAK